MKFSVITVVYNGVKHLEQTINSVLNQKNVEIQYIIIDGGSTDGTIEIIKKYSDKIDYWVSEPDGGLYYAMNKGLEHADGDIVSFINSDDWYEDGTLECVQKSFDNETDIVCGRINLIKDECKYKSVGYFEGSLDMLHCDNILSHPSTFSRRKLYDLVGNFNTKYKICADYEWGLRAYNKGFKIKLIPEILANFRLGGTSDVNAYSRECESYAIKMSTLNGHIEYIDEIRRRYINACKNEAVIRLQSDKFENVESILDIKSSYYIWGTGVMGRECLELLKSKNINIIGFIDSEPKLNFIETIPVYSKKDFFCKYSQLADNKRLELIVTPEKYEDEIITDILITLPTTEEKIIRYSMIREWALNKYIR